MRRSQTDGKQAATEGRFSLFWRTVTLLLVALSVQGPASAEPYRLDAGDKLQLQVEEWPPLTGEFTVSGDRKLRLPVVGPVDAGGKSEEELANDIAMRLQEGKSLPVLPRVTVGVSVYRPFYILGDVQRPNEYPYRPNMRVQEAISIAGGFYRPNDTAATRFERDAIVAKGELKSDIEKFNRFRIRQARLTAERDGEKSFHVPASELIGVQQSELKAFMDSELAAFSAREAEFATRTGIYDNLIGLYEKEIESLKVQIEAEQRQLQAINAEMAAITSLANKGLSLSQRQWTVERTLAQITGTKQALETQIVRTRQSITLARDKIESIRSERRVQADVELVKVAIEVAELRAKVATSRQLVAQAEQFSPVAMMDRLARRGWKVTANISRITSGGEAKTISADLTDVLQPGDVVTIERRPDIHDE